MDFHNHKTYFSKRARHFLKSHFQILVSLHVFIPHVYLFIFQDGLYNPCADVPSHLQGLIGTRPSLKEGNLYSTIVLEIIRRLNAQKPVTSRPVEVGNLLEYVSDCQSYSYYSTETPCSQCQTSAVDVRRSMLVHSQCSSSDVATLKLDLSYLILWVSCFQKFHVACLLVVTCQLKLLLSRARSFN